MVYPFDSGILHVVFSYGNEAVNFFFFLSGYIMVIAYYKPDKDSRSINKWKYWLNRFARIYPVYFLAILLVTVYYIAIDRELFTSFSIRLPLELLLLQSWVGKSSLNFPGWSLSVEMLFYLVFPFALAYFSKFRPGKLIIVSVLVYLSGQLLFISALDSFGTDVKSKLAIEYFPFFNLSTFILGVLTALIFVQNRDWLLKYRVPVKVFGYPLMVLVFILLYFGVDFHTYHHNGLLAPVYALFLVIFSLPSRLTNWLGNPAFVFLGDISYSIYILQYPVWLFYRYFLHIEGSWRQFEFWGYVGALVIISALVYKLYEQRLQNQIRYFSR